MANIKITKKDGGYQYQAPGHFDCILNRLHDAADVTDGAVTIGLSRFFPGGGTNYGSAPKESVYYIVEGQMLFTDDEGKETLLEKGDSAHIAANAKKSVKNTGTTDTLMLVVLK